jgi:hypothetical protein
MAINEAVIQEGRGFCNLYGRDGLSCWSVKYSILRWFVYVDGWGKCIDDFDGHVSNNICRHSSPIDKVLELSLVPPTSRCPHGINSFIIHSAVCHTTGP